MSRAASDRKYQEKYPAITVRLPKEILDQIPSPRQRNAWIVDAVKIKLHTNTRQEYERSDQEYEKKIQEYRSYLVFFFHFFDKNKKKFSISDEERTKIKAILGELQDES